VTDSGFAGDLMEDRKILVMTNKNKNKKDTCPGKWDIELTRKFRTGAKVTKLARSAPQIRLPESEHECVVGLGGSSRYLLRYTCAVWQRILSQFRIEQTLTSTSGFFFVIKGRILQILLS